MKKPLYREVKRLKVERDLYKKVLTQIATQPRGSLSRRLARSVISFVDEINKAKG
jgi:hypothetical protein